eukprot:TRINITY_DN18537_c0_g1_i3.p1 TRINITY_DN18537_c0_g1~~TRINITY_DN18537_c0_g1_i3.p1  ORF type:complete len:120 (-),score=18.25 TRINITY_DN18537_c0_g1_i3:1-330(-)
MGVQKHAGLNEYGAADLVGFSCCLHVRFDNQEKRLIRLDVNKVFVGCRCKEFDSIDFQLKSVVDLADLYTKILIKTAFAHSVSVCESGLKQIESNVHSHIGCLWVGLEV